MANKASPLRLFILLFASVLGLAGSGTAITATEPSATGSAERVATVRGFLNAFNSHDAAAMAEFTTSTISWLSVDAQRLTVEVEGREPLVSAMEAYFLNCPTCRSAIVDLMASRSRVSTLEEASWTGPKGQRSQRAIAVYEFEGALIERVYYFPAESPQD